MLRGTTITPVLRYQDASAAAGWLCEAFGFEEHDRAQELDGHVRFISLRLGDSFVLVRPVANSVFDDLMVQPEAVGGGNTQVCYLTIADTDEHRARAKTAGARIELEPQDDGLGGRFYTCRDLEGHLWSFGTRTYGLAADAAGAFEPAELSPTHPSTGIAAPQKQAQRSPLRTLGIAAAGAVVAVGGWIAYGTYVGGSATATTARVEEAVEQLTQERNRRAAAEDATRDAAAKLTEERGTAADLRQTLQRVQADLEQARQSQPAGARAAGAVEVQEALQRAQADLEDARRAQIEALASSQQHRLANEQAQAQLAVAKEQAGQEAAQLEARLAKQEQDRRLDKEQLREVEIALLAAKKQLEELRASQLEPMYPDSGEPIPEDAPCVVAVQGKIPSAHKGPNTWVVANLGRLCRGAESSVEPARCFEELMRGKTNWGAGTVWMTSNALALCGGTRSARRTLDCFSKQVSSNQTWQIAIKQCRTN